MEVTIHDRTHTVGPELHSYAAKKVASLADHFDLIRPAEIEFDRDLKKRRQPLEVVKVTPYLLGHRLGDLRATRPVASSAPPLIWRSTSSTVSSRS